jgi:two-component system, sensor histidine kinase and response regulator
MSEEPVLDGAALERLRRVGGNTLVHRLLELYLANGPERIRSLSDGAAAGDVQRVERVAHTMKSSAGNLGAARLQRTAEALEAGAAAGMIDDELVARLVREYDEAAAALRSVLDEQVR